MQFEHETGSHCRPHPSINTGNSAVRSTAVDNKKTESYTTPRQLVIGMDNSKSGPVGVLDDENRGLFGFDLIRTKVVNYPLVLPVTYADIKPDCDPAGWVSCVEDSLPSPESFGFI